MVRSTAVSVSLATVTAVAAALAAPSLVPPVATFRAAALVSVATAQEKAADEPLFRGLTLKLVEARAESGDDIRKVALDAARRVGGDTPWMVRDVRPPERTFRLAVPPVESSAAVTPAEAWQKTHALRQDTRFEYVEPTFAVQGAPAETTELEDCVATPVVESGGSEKPITGAVNDPEWSLDKDHGANVLEAWKAFGTSVPGQDVWIGHPDTGYRRHPEVWGMANSPLQATLGWDFVDNDDDPTDAFAEGILRWPGHGTRTSSAIVSPRGRQLPGAGPRGISGVAPGARLIPLRVANGVVLFDQANLASAIRAAAGDDRTLVKQRVDVISISLGGPPSRMLEDAVRLAERNGVIVIAAAGNNVKKVIWPARYPHVIALAASNYNSEVWRGSSGGSVVAIGAPGESVWIASPKVQGNAAVDCLSMSSGTSYATATTAGIAALWVSRHKKTPQFQALVKSGEVTAAFRRILRATSRPGKNWDTGKYGAGIVDAAKVLAAPLPIPEQASVPVPRSRCDADLAALESLFDRSPEPRQRLAGLFGTTPAGACAIASLADEVAFHYATNDAVSDAIDRISGPASPDESAWAAARSALRAVGSPALQQALPAAKTP